MYPFSNALRKGERQIKVIERGDRDRELETERWKKSRREKEGLNQQVREGVSLQYPRGERFKKIGDKSLKDGEKKIRR